MTEKPFDEELLRERESIVYWAQKLADGEVDGPKTLTRLVELTELKRWKVTLRHVDLKIAFQERVGDAPLAARHNEKLEREVVHQREKAKKLREEKEQLETVLQVYAAVIAELTTELAGLRESLELPTNVTRLPRGSRD